MGDIIIFFLAVVGGFVMFMTIVVAICLVIAEYRSKKHNELIYNYEEAQRTAKENFLQNLSYNAKWFSEHEPTMYLLSQMSEDRNVATVRDEWRKKMQNLKINNEILYPNEELR